MNTAVIPPITEPRRPTSDAASRRREDGATFDQVYGPELERSRDAIGRESARQNDPSTTSESGTAGERNER